MDVMRKIRKCLDLANDKRGDQNLAATALRQAQALMREHGITEDHVNVSGVSETPVKSKVGITRPPQWESLLLEIVCKAFGCASLWAAGGPEPTRKGAYIIFGPRSSQEVCHYAFIVLQRQLLKARNTRVAEMDDDLPRGVRIKAADSFCMGWAIGVSGNLEKFSGNRAVRQSLLAQYAKLFHHLDLDNPEHTVDARMKDIDSASIVAGHKAGQGVHLSRPVETEVESPLQLTHEGDKP